MFATRRSNGRVTPPTRKLVKKGSSLRDLRPLTERIVLEKVLGITLKGNSGLACNPITGEIAFPAGCVIVIVSSSGYGQNHIVNSSRKTISSLAFSPDGKFLVSGESGHEPAVRVWDAEDNTHPQVSEMTKGHKHGIQSVAFSPNMKYVVSVGFQHDMLVNIWNWREGTAIACNKVSSKVYAISFSESGDYFVTVGVRIVKFWYIGSTDNVNIKVKKKIPLRGRPAILAEKRDNHFIDVACGIGSNSKLTYSVTKSGLLCCFNEKRLLEKWVELRANGAFSLVVNEQLIFCGCSDGIIRVFNSSTLQFIGSLPKPHCLGVDVAAGQDVSHLINKIDNASYPDTIALAVDQIGSRLTCVYNDHSIYVWDIKDIKKIGKISSFLYHNSCIWAVEVFPDATTNGKIPHGSFMTCSSDGTVRIWNIDSGSKMSPYRNIYSKELIQVLYTETELMNLKDTKSHKENGHKESELKSGLRCIKLSPQGHRLASGDKMGNIRIFDVISFNEIIKIEAHESEVLCLEYSSPQSGFDLLASAGRDRLIHVFDCGNNFNLLQTLDDHSASITSIRFNLSESMIFQLISCSADKSVIFRSAQKEPEFQFVRYTNVATKTTFYDMDIHPLRTYTVTAGHDRNMRVYDIASGKQLRSFKAAMGDDGVIFKVLLDRSGYYAATSCSDKSVALYDFDIGECVAGMVGHSEIVTGFQFSLDCERLITVSADGCIFIWKLPSAFCQNMMDKMQELDWPHRTILDDVSETDGVDNGFRPASHEMFDSNQTNTLLEEYRMSVIHRLPSWAKKQVATNDLEVALITDSVHETSLLNTRPKPEGRWAERFDPSQIFPQSPDENEKSVDNSPESKQAQLLDVLANKPLEKRFSNGSLNGEPHFCEDAELALQEYEKDFKSKALEDLKSNVTLSRGSDVNQSESTADVVVEGNDFKNTVVKDFHEDIIYYPHDEDLEGDATRNVNKKEHKTKESKVAVNAKPNVKPEIKSSSPINISSTPTQSRKTSLKKRTIENILHSPTNEISFFEMRAGNSMDNLVIHQVDFTQYTRQSPYEQPVQKKPYDVKSLEDCTDERESNPESSPVDDTDEPTGDSISDEEDLLTTETVPKWEELPEIPAPTFERAEMKEEFFPDIITTPTELKEELLFEDATKAIPNEPLPFDRNTFHRTSISARFIQRSKQSSLRSTNDNEKNEGWSSNDNNVDLQKNNEVQKRKRELEETKKRLEALGFKSLDNWTRRHSTVTNENKDSDNNLTSNGPHKESIINESKHVSKDSRKVGEKPEELSQKETLDVIITKKRKDQISSENTKGKESEILAGIETGKSAELIAFFDSTEKTNKTKTGKKSEKARTYDNQEEKKTKGKDTKDKTTLNKLKTEDKKQKSQNRRSFPFNIAKLTRKPSDKRKSTASNNLSKTKSCGDLLSEQKTEASEEQMIDEPGETRNINNSHIVTKPENDEPTTVQSHLSVLSAELTAALATPPPKLVQLNISRDYLISNGDVTKGYRRKLGKDEGKASSEVTTSECQEVVVDLVRAFERAVDYHSKILNGDIKDNQRQDVSMLAATFTTMSESIADCKIERETRLLRSPRAVRNAEITTEQRTDNQHETTSDHAQQTDYTLSRDSELMAPLLEKYSELLLKKLEEKMDEK